MPLSFLSDHRETGDLPPVATPLLALAPLHLSNRRQSRYLGDGLYFPLRELAPHDQDLVRRLYEMLTDLVNAIADQATDDAQKWRAVAAWKEQHPLDTLVGEIRELGQASHAQTPGEELAKTMHDVRGGAVTALIGRLELAGFRPPAAGDLNTLFILVRDHLKIMRNALTGLDEPRREADHTPKSHDVRLILEKWHESVVGPKWREKPIRMFVDCRFEGALTECCLESAAVDRIFYNLANNACRHAAEGRLDLAIFPVPAPLGDCLRFVLSNAVSEEDLAGLRALLGGPTTRSDRNDEANLRTLFEPAVSSTGSGFGLTVVAEFVAHAFGLRNRQEALRERYVGAVLDDHTFRVWFHWPVANSHLPPKLDDYHHPEQSLSEA